jgi:hypothetical protein
MDDNELKLVEFLEWALEMIDNNFKEFGKIGFAEIIVYKAARAFIKQVKNA